MATTASITIEVDDQGALGALQDINNEAGKLGPKLVPIGAQSQQVFGKMEKSTTEARQSVQLLASNFGIVLPRALETVLAKSSLIGPALNMAFNASVVIAVGAAALQAADNFATFIQSIRNAGEDYKALYNSVLQTNNILRGPQTLEQLRTQVIQTTKSQSDLQQKLGLTGDLLSGIWAFGVRKYSEQWKFNYEQLQHVNEILPGLQQQLAQMQDVQSRTEPVEIMKQENDARLAGLQGIQKINAAESGQTAVLKAEIAAHIVSEKLGEVEITNIHAQARAQRKALEQQNSDQTRALQNQATLAGMNSLDQITEKTRQAEEEQFILKSRGLSNDREFAAREVALEQIKQSQIIQTRHDAAAQGQQAMLQAEASGAAGREQIERAYLAQLQQITQQEQKTGIDMIGARKAAEITKNNDLLAINRQYFDELADLETQAAISSLPAWRRADAQIVADAQKRIQQIRDLEAKDASFREQGELEVGLVIQQAWNQRVQNMSDQIYNLFQTITSGGIGKFFLDMFEHLVSKMVATWFLGMKQMQAASASSGILGWLFGLLGIKAPGASGAPGSGSTVGVDAGGTGIPGLGGGGSVTAAASLGGSAIASAAGLNLGNAAGAASGQNVSTTGLLSGLGLSAGQGGSVPGAVLPAGAGIFAQLQSKLGGSGGLAQLQATAGMALFSLAGKAGPFGGAGIGALAGALLGGIGAIIGAIIGGLLGLFGSSKRQKAIKNLEGQLEDQIKQVVDSYNNYQTDYSSAFQSLESLRSQYHDAMHKLGGDTNTRVEAHVNVAEQQIKATDAERQRRAAIVFGPAQFHRGGFVDPALAAGMSSGFASSALRFAGGGEVPAILHAGEFVLQPSAVRRMGRGNLERMNAGGGGGGIGGDIHIHGPLIHADKIDEAWLRNGGAKLIWQQFRRMANSGELEYGM
jgi:hypothetical protein